MVRYTRLTVRNALLVCFLLLLPTVSSPQEYDVRHNTPAYSIVKIVGSLIGVTMRTILVTGFVATAILHILEAGGVLESLVYLPVKAKETFDDVIGLDDAKTILQDVVEYIHHPYSYHLVGARMPGGILLTGEPGNGKTLLAKALAGEAKCSFLSVSGSEFTGILVGLGVLRIKLLFFWARKYAPCIIFIDEIDSLGGKRATDFNSRVYDQTLNELLAKMDGFASKKNIFIVGATNRVEDLDPALLRPGRFDRIIQINKPTFDHRKAMLALYSKRVRLDSNVDFDSIARGTVGFSGADIANLVNQVALLAKRNQQQVITTKDFDDAIAVLYLGGKSTIKLSEHERRVVAFHEAGHALCNIFYSAETDPLHMITIEPYDNGALGVSWSRSIQEKNMTSEQELRARIIVCMGGRAAEELVFKSKMSGAASDFKQAHRLAEKLVCQYGMHESIGFLACDVSGDPFQFSQETKQKIEEAISSVLQQCYTEAKDLLKKNRDKLELLAYTLLEKTTLMADEVYELLAIVPAHCIA
jgi:cell division protease FtsH